MQKRAYIAGFGFAAALLLAACAASQSGLTHSVKECNNTECPDINVSVAGGQISLDADTMKVRKNNPKVQIRWRLDPHSDHEFHNDSIRFKDPQAASRQFRFKSQNGQMIHYEDENSDRNDYGYTIVVFDKKTGQPVSKDPIIANQGF